MKNPVIFCLLLIFVPSLIAQQAAQAAERAGRNYISGDDDEQVQIVPADLSSPGPRKFHGGAVLKSVRQVSIFWGSHWADSQVRTRETSLLDLPASDGTLTNELQNNKIAIVRAAPSVDELTVVDGTINDLAIQSKLAALLRTKTIPAPGTGTVYVIYLGPGINSSLGSHKGGINYLAYHNDVHLEDGEIDYVVVPYHADAATHRAAAGRAFVEAVLNPNGGGWY
jgi:hypothetical protein